MTDIIGGISLTALYGLVCAVLITAIPLRAAVRVWLAAGAVVWFSVVAMLAAVGAFSAGTFAVGIAVLAPVAVALFAAARSSTLRTAVLEISPAPLVAIHAGRILGVFFLLLLGAGRLPPTFASTAGWGDIGIAVAAVPLAWAIHRRVAGWRTLALAWNVLGFLDLVAAVTLGVGSAPESPVRFIFESPGSGAIAFLPWVIIPTLLVPLYLSAHMAMFAQLARGFGLGRERRPAGDFATAHRDA